MRGHTTRGISLLVLLVGGVCVPRADASAQTIREFDAMSRGEQDRALESLAQTLEGNLFSATRRGESKPEEMLQAHRVMGNLLRALIAAPPSQRSDTDVRGAQSLGFGDVRSAILANLHSNPDGEVSAVFMDWFRSSVNRYSTSFSSSSEIHAYPDERQIAYFRMVIDNKAFQQEYAEWSREMHTALRVELVDATAELIGLLVGGAICRQSAAAFASHPTEGRAFSLSAEGQVRYSVHAVAQQDERRVKLSESESTFDLSDIGGLRRSTAAECHVVELLCRVGTCVTTREGGRMRRHPSVRIFLRASGAADDVEEAFLSLIEEFASSQ